MAPTTQGRESTPTRPGHVEASLRIASLAATVGITRAQLAALALEELATQFQSPFAAVELQFPTEVVNEECSEGSSNPDFWRPQISDALTESMADEVARARLFEHKEREVQIALVQVPIVLSAEGTNGALAMIAPCSGPDDAQQVLATLGTLACLLGHCIETTTAPQTASADKPREGADALRKVAGYSSPVELAFALTNSLRNRTGCDQVALGRVAKKRVRILSISGLDEIKAKSPGVVALQAAMDECLDARRPVVAQDTSNREDAHPQSGHRLHAQWRAASGHAAVTSLPLFAGDELVGVLSLRRRAAEPFTQEDVQKFREQVEPYMAGMELVERAGLSLFRHTLRSTVGAALALVRPRGWFKKVLVLGLFALLGWFAFGTASYTLSIPCAVQPTESRHVGAPFDAVLVESSVLPGDRVEAGAILGRFDTRELELQANQLEAEVAGHRLAERQALAAGEQLDLLLARAELKRAEAELAVLLGQIEAAVLRAPVGGTLLEGDLRARVGDVIAKGTPLYQITPDDAWKLELRVPERDVDELRRGLRGRFASHARPDQPQGLVVGRIFPSAESAEGEAIVLAEARTRGGSGWLRPGMEGMAVVEIGERRVCWIALHRFVDLFRLHFWL